MSSPDFDDKALVSRTKANKDIIYNAIEVLRKSKDINSAKILIDIFKSDEEDVCVQVVEALREVGNGVVPQLITALKSEVLSVRFWAVRTLSEIKDERAIEPLIDVFNDVEQELGCITEKFLATYGTIAVPQLIAALDNISWSTRCSSINTLSYIKDERAVVPLIEKLNEKDVTVRELACLALGELGDKRAVEPLILALSDGESNVRGHAASALGELRDNQAVEPLIKAAKDEDSNVRWHIVSALGNIGDKRALPVLNLLGRNDIVDEVRTNAFRAIQQIENLSQKLEQ